MRLLLRYNDSVKGRIDLLALLFPAVQPVGLEVKSAYVQVHLRVEQVPIWFANHEFEVGFNLS